MRMPAFTGLVLRCKALADHFNERHRGAAIGATLVVLGHFARQLGDPFNRIERPRFGDDTFLHEEMKNTLAQH